MLYFGVLRHWPIRFMFKDFKHFVQKVTHRVKIEQECQRKLTQNPELLLYPHEIGKLFMD